ncbi:MAG: tetratricopeptide repeat protein [Methanoregula sp.]
MDFSNGEKKIDGKNSAMWLREGIILDSSGRHEDAINAYDRVIELDPKHVAAWVNKGYSLSALERHNDALKAFECVIEIYPEYAIAWYNKGKINAILKKYKEALNCYDQCLKIDPYYDSAKKGKKELLKALPKPKLSIIFYQPQLSFDVWDKVSIQIKNAGNERATDVKISFSNDFETRGMKPVNLNADATLTLDFAIKSKSKGKFPFEITATYKDEINKEYNQTFEFWIEVLSSQTGISIESGKVYVKDSNQKPVKANARKKSPAGTADLIDPLICPDCSEEINIKSKWCSNCGKKLK